MLEYHTQLHYTTYVGFTYTWNQDLLTWERHITMVTNYLLYYAFWPASVFLTGGYNMRYKYKWRHFHELFTPQKLLCVYNNH